MAAACKASSGLGAGSPCLRAGAFQTRHTVPPVWWGRASGELEDPNRELDIDTRWGASPNRTRGERKVEGREARGCGPNMTISNLKRRRGGRGLTVRRAAVQEYQSEEIHNARVNGGSDCDSLKE